MRPIIYLDIDDVLLRFPFLVGDPAAKFYSKYPDGAPTAGAAEFLTWATGRFDVRWLSMWCVNGVLSTRYSFKLARLLELPVRTIDKIANPLSFYHASASATHSLLKTNAIDWLAFDLHRRPFCWIAPEIKMPEIKMLRNRNALGNFYECNSSKEPGKLRTIFERLQVRLRPCPECQEIEDYCRCADEVPASSK